ncbi:MAG: DUF2200 domain-containing protein [Sphaerochaetaceae bacterium]|nr:DUF2200 domain-containing protein [Sphaerochaetaceae bacterium]MDC7248198.1 DUF2200 domain-containing protein [Sphaerochaetaceae bacterium]
MKEHKIFSMSFSSVYPHYIAKAEKKGRNRSEVDRIICWLTGYDEKGLTKQLESNCSFRTFFAEAPLMNPKRVFITGTICNVKIEQITDPLMKEIRYLDKLIDELAKGKPLDRILRK